MRTYSTCSFNPLENEAVVCALVQRSGAELLELPALENLPMRPGLKTWKVMDEDQELQPGGLSLSLGSRLDSKCHFQAI